MLDKTKNQIRPRTWGEFCALSEQEQAAEGKRMFNDLASVGGNINRLDALDPANKPDRPSLPIDGPEHDRQPQAYLNAGSADCDDAYGI
jgi:hypothetical protein